VGIEDIAVRRPTLDDVFLVLTGRAAEEDGGAGEDGAGPREGAPGEAGERQESLA
jgi:ABC-2 type transport system ATP-binding protein